MKLFLIILLLLLMISLMVVLYLLVSPLKLIVDSRKGMVVLGWNRWLHAKMDEENHKWWVVVSIPFWRKRYPAKDLMILQKLASEKAPPEKDSQNGRSKFSWRKFRRLLRCIKIVDFQWELDTDDYIWNAYLTPVFQLLNRKRGVQTHVNFYGKNEIRIVAHTRMINMLKASMY